ncbi:phosphoribosylformylglycinamidine synthase I [Lignipirellula cremea]|uniref:Phosphoribosylformylglycinamidine synthase n=1 Tax=Lignipirellula cremea TaxID=2528010 RepID=A0A518DY32_9BACT|nr:phosphoribosylformylglycinamidine synthase I [Lignipirellula cremea]QDU96756.1 Phosphoribosylformylglycinamidine synthase [Lignipirellula cremea]
MPAPRVLVLRAPGANCDEETAFAFEKAGAKAERVHINRWLESPGMAASFQILCIPGGFSYGDDIAAGRILGNQIRRHLNAAMGEFKESGKLILGICNGFQTLLKSGVLVEEERGEPAATLTWNDSQKFEDRWAGLRVDGAQCVFLRGIESLYLPVAHAEGKFLARDAETLAALQSAGQLVLRYANDTGEDAIDYPANPNGSEASVAGVCDATGRVFGLMPHPERYIERTHHPRWTRGEGTQPGQGLQIFRNAVEYFQ